MEENSEADVTVGSLRSVSQDSEPYSGGAKLAADIANTIDTEDGVITSSGKVFGDGLPITSGQVRELLVSLRRLAYQFISLTRARLTRRSRGDRRRQSHYLRTQCYQSWCKLRCERYLTPLVYKLNVLSAVLHFSSVAGGDSPAPIVAQRPEGVPRAASGGGGRAFA
jgi:hypothetical protein